MSIRLQIKIASLAAEARLIRQKEQKLYKRHRTSKRREPGSEPPTDFFIIKEHRLSVIRPEARCALLAYGFLRGRSIEQIEGKPLSQPDWSRVQRLVEKYASNIPLKDLREAFAAWKDGGPGLPKPERTPSLAA